jgi:hypothetical protein
MIAFLLFVLSVAHFFEVRLVLSFYVWSGLSLIRSIVIVVASLPAIWFKLSFLFILFLNFLFHLLHFQPQLHLINILRISLLHCLLHHLLQIHQFHLLMKTQLLNFNTHLPNMHDGALSQNPPSVVWYLHLVFSDSQVQTGSCNNVTRKLNTYWQPKAIPRVVSGLLCEFRWCFQNL